MRSEVVKILIIHFRNDTHVDLLVWYFSLCSPRDGNNEQTLKNNWNMSLKSAIHFYYIHIYIYIYSFIWFQSAICLSSGYNVGAQGVETTVYLRCLLPASLHHMFIYNNASMTRLILLLWQVILALLSLIDGCATYGRRIEVFPSLSLVHGRAVFMVWVIPCQVNQNIGTFGPDPLGFFSNLAHHKFHRR
jgi:hypothetical protein